MVIQGVKLRNFRSFRAAEILFGRKNIILGANGSGKSSIIDALCYAVDGTCRGTDEGGKGSEVLIHYFWMINHGDPLPEGIVEIGTDKGIFRRAIGQGPASKIGVSIREGLGARRDALRAIFRPGTFLSMPPGDQMALFTSLSAPEDISGVAKEHLGDLLEPAALPKTMRQLDDLDREYRRRRPEQKAAIVQAEGETTSYADFDSDFVSMTDEEIAEATAEAAKLLRELKDDRDRVLLKESKDIPPALPLDLSEATKHKRTVDELDGMLSPFPGTPKNCPHCGKKVVLLEGTKELMTVENARDTEAKLRKMLGDATAARLKAVATTPAPRPAAPAAASKERRAIEERIVKGEGVYGALGRLALLRSQQSKKTAKIKSMRETLARYEKVIEVVASKGPLRAALLERKSGGLDLVAAVNQVCDAAGWGKVVFRTEPWEISMGKVPAEVLSTSQRLALNIAIQTAIAVASGVKILVVDEAQTFEEDSRGALAEALAVAMEHVDQLFVLASKSRDEMSEYQVGPGWKFIPVILKDGLSVVVPQS